MKTFVYASDLHGDFQDHKTVDTLLKFCDSFNPDVRLFGGDLFDFRNIRRGAGPMERQDSMAADVEAGMQFLRDFKPHVFLLGNHDSRLWDTAKFHENGMVRDAAQKGVRDITAKCRSLKCKMLPYESDKGFYDLGKVRFIHGYHTGIYARLNGGRGMGVGCLAQLHMDYNRHQTARMIHAHGFAYGYSDKKDWNVWQAKEGVNGKWVVAKELMTL